MARGVESSRQPICNVCGGDCGGGGCDCGGDCDCGGSRGVSWIRNGLKGLNLD